MSGIAGLWNLDGRPVEPALLAAIGSRQSHRGPDGEGRWLEGPIGLSCQTLRATRQCAPESLPLVHASGAVAVFDGRLDNCDDLLSSLRSPGLCADSSDAAFVLAAYDSYGDRFVEHLNGDFALGVFDPRKQQLLLARDAIGIKPLHYCLVGDTFVFASEIKSLFAHPQVVVAPNDEALAGFLLRGYEYGTEGHTFFKNVFSVPPAHLAAVTRQRLTTRQYWDFDTSRQVRLGSFAEYSEAFTEHFTRAVRRRLRTSSPTAVSVSGGLDSSSIFCVAQQESRRPAGVHAPIGISHMAPEGSTADERCFLLDIEREYGVEIDRIPGGAPGVMNQARDELWHVEAPFLDALGNRHHEFMRAARRRGVRLLLGGHWGDQVLCDRSYLVDLALRLRWITLWTHLRELPRWYAGVERPGFTRAFLHELLRDHSPRALLAMAKKIRARTKPPIVGAPVYTAAFRQKGVERTSPTHRRGGSPGTAHAKALYADVRNGYNVLCMESNDKAAAMYGLEMAFPFLDRDLLSFLMAIPGEMQTWNGVPKALLRAGLRAAVPASILARCGKADFTDLMNEGMEREHPQVSDCLQAPGLAFAWGYVERADTISELNRLDGRVSGPDGWAAWGLQELVSLELWLQVFFGNSFESSTGKGARMNHAGPH
jgi:asparagine synthase (glutamine-hydrolysing)